MKVVAYLRALFLDSILMPFRLLSVKRSIAYHSDMARRGSVLVLVQFNLPAFQFPFILRSLTHQCPAARPAIESNHQSSTAELHICQSFDNLFENIWIYHQHTDDNEKHHQLYAAKLQFIWLSFLASIFEVHCTPLGK